MRPYPRGYGFGDMNLCELLNLSAERRPEKPALVEGDTVVSYAGLVDRVATLAAQLQVHRLPPGARVGLCYGNSVNYVALTFALWRLDAVVVPIPMECPVDEVLALAHEMHLAAIISQSQIGAGVSVAADIFFTDLKPAESADNHGLKLAFIRFTSGTTSARKGVALTHETVRDRIAVANRALGIGSEDTVMWCLPMSHHFLITIVLYLSAGATVVLARHLVARPFLDSVNRWQGTVLYAAPFHYALLARDTSGVGLASVRLVVATTCALPQDVADDFFRRFNLPIAPALGIIELGLVSLNTEDPRGRWNSVGRPLKDLQVKILAPDADGCGEVAISGPGFLDAYAAPWVSRDRLLQDGWFVTDDIGRLDAEGFLFLVGRKTAVINLAGRKVFPEEIESVLNRHPAVVESRVYGRAHAHLGEVVEADIVLAHPEAGTDSVLEFCRGKLASYKIPTRLHIVSSLPRTAVTGKIRRALAVA